MEASGQLALYLLQSKAIIIDPATPFQWASGWKSPIYCDNRKTLSYPEIRTFIRDAFIELIREKFDPPDMIAGVATGAIAHAALVADAMSLPLLYVRSAQKTHGLGNQVEGDLRAGKTAVVVEDLVSTGGSSLNAAAALTRSGIEVLGMAAIFTYGFQVAEERFQKAGVPLHTLCNYHILLERAIQTGYIRTDDLDTLKEWRENPAAWQSAGSL
jgi:orotate phosphoribosyltransferase